MRLVARFGATPVGLTLLAASTIIQIFLAEAASQSLVQKQQRVSLASDPSDFLISSARRAINTSPSGWTNTARALPAPKQQVRFRQLVSSSRKLGDGPFKRIAMRSIRSDDSAPKCICARLLKDIDSLEPVGDMFEGDLENRKTGKQDSSGTSSRQLNFNMQMDHKQTKQGSVQQGRPQQGGIAAQNFGQFNRQQFRPPFSGNNKFPFGMSPNTQISGNPSASAGASSNLSGSRGAKMQFVPQAGINPVSKQIGTLAPQIGFTGPLSVAQANQFIGRNVPLSPGSTGVVLVQSLKAQKANDKSKNKKKNNSKATSDPIVVQLKNFPNFDGDDLIDANPGSQTGDVSISSGGVDIIVVPSTRPPKANGKKNKKKSKPKTTPDPVLEHLKNFGGFSNGDSSDAQVGARADSGPDFNSDLKKLFQTISKLLTKLFKSGNLLDGTDDTLNGVLDSKRGSDPFGLDAIQSYINDKFKDVLKAIGFSPSSSRGLLDAANVPNQEFFNILPIFGGKFNGLNPDSLVKFSKYFGQFGDIFQKLSIFLDPSKLTKLDKGFKFDFGGNGSPFEQFSLFNPKLGSDLVSKITGGGLSKLGATKSRSNNGPELAKLMNPEQGVSALENMELKMDSFENKIKNERPKMEIISRRKRDVDDSSEGSLQQNENEDQGKVNSPPTNDEFLDLGSSKSNSEETISKFIKKITTVDENATIEAIAPGLKPVGISLEEQPKTNDQVESTPRDEQQDKEIPGSESPDVELLGLGQNGIDSGSESDQNDEVKEAKKPKRLGKEDQSEFNQLPSSQLLSDPEKKQLFDALQKFPFRVDGGSGVSLTDSNFKTALKFLEANALALKSFDFGPSRNTARIVDRPGSGASLAVARNDNSKQLSEQELQKKVIDFVTQFVESLEPEESDFDSAEGEQGNGEDAVPGPEELRNLLGSVFDNVDGSEFYEIEPELKSRPSESFGLSTPGKPSQPAVPPNIERLPEGCTKALADLDLLLQNLSELFDKLTESELIHSVNNISDLARQLSLSRALTREAQMALQLSNLDAINTFTRLLAYQLDKLKRNQALSSVVPLLDRLLRRISSRYFAYKRGCLSLKPTGDPTVLVALPIQVDAKVETSGSDGSTLSSDKGGSKSQDENKSDSGGLINPDISINVGDAAGVQIGDKTGDGHADQDEDGFGNGVDEKLGLEVSDAETAPELADFVGSGNNENFGSHLDADQGLSEDEEFKGLGLTLG